MPTVVWETLPEEQTISSLGSQAFFRLLTLPCLFLYYLPTQQCSAPWGLSKEGCMSLKAPNFRELGWQGPMLVPWVRVLRHWD